jgi:hypothetical protein
MLMLMLMPKLRRQRSISADAVELISSSTSPALLSPPSSHRLEPYLG